MIDLWSYNYDLLSDEGDWDDPTGDHDDGMESEGDETCDRFAYAQPRPLPSAEGEGGTGPTEDGVTPAEGGVAVVDDDDDAPNRPDPEEFNDGRYSVISSSTFSHSSPSGRTCSNCCGVCTFCSFALCCCTMLVTLARSLRKSMSLW